MEDNDIMPLICIRCKKYIPLTVKTFKEVSYTHYSYCEECLRKGLKALKAWDLLYKRIYDHHYEILKMEEGEVKRAKLSLSNWVLDLMTGELDYDYVPDINVGEMAESEQQPCEDCISREAVKEQMIKYGFKAPDMTVTEFVEDCLPSVTPKAEQKDVLGKIRAEIEQLTSRYSISKERGGMGQVEWSDRLIKESDVLQIIDKYKADKEGEE